MRTSFKPHPAQKKIFESNKRYEVISKIPRRLGYGTFLKSIEGIKNISNTNQMKTELELAIIKILEEKNPGLLPDEIDFLVEKILFGINIYEEAKAQLSTPTK